MISSDEDSFDDEIFASSDYTEFDITTDYESDSSETVVQPTNFRECLRLLDTALAASSSFALPSWCGSGQIKSYIDPKISVRGNPRYLSFPFNKQAARQIVQRAERLHMNIDILNEVVISSSAYKLSSESFKINNNEWKSQIEQHLIESCISKTLQMDPNDIQLKVSHFVLIESSDYPREFCWKKEDADESTIAKLFLNLPSMYKNGKETISYIKEKHTFDRSDKDYQQASYWTLVPFTDECKYEIDLISYGYKFILIYDVIPLNRIALYKVEVDKTIFERIRWIFEKWTNGLSNNFHDYASKIIVPFSDFFQPNSNILLYGADRVVGTILHQAIQRYCEGKFKLFSGFIQPNRSNHGTEHVCRSITGLKQLTIDNDHALFDHIESCVGNCNETFTGNIFIRRTFSGHGNIITIEQYVVPIWCIVPLTHKYELFLNHLSSLTINLEQILISFSNRSEEVLAFIDWILSTSKKIQFNTKIILRQLLKLTNNKTMPDKLMILIRKLLMHKRFIEYFLSIKEHQDYDDIIRLLKFPKETQFQLYIHKTVQSALKRCLYGGKIRIKHIIKFIGVLAFANVDKCFVFLLIHDLLMNLFGSNDSRLSITDLINLLSLLATFIDLYDTSCEFIAHEIIIQMKLLKKTTTNTLTTTNLLREVLVPTLIYIYCHRTNDCSSRLPKSKKRKTINDHVFPRWFSMLYETCISILDAYCNSYLPIPCYSNISFKFQNCCCSICKDLFVFLKNKYLFEKIFFISKNEFNHFRTVTHSLNPLLIYIESMSTDTMLQKVIITKMSDYDEDLWRENNLLYSLLRQISYSDSLNGQYRMIEHKRQKIVH